MIARLCGILVERGTNHVLMEVKGLTYEILIPTAVMQRLQEVAQPQGELRLVTFHYHQVEPSRSTPVLIGFLNEIEREFFEVFITVSGIGPRAALRALNKPISQIARAIDEGDVDFLRSLPGIGPQRAREIVAKLQHKIGKFGLVQDAAAGGTQACAETDIEQEAVEVLMQLEYKKPEAVAMVKKAMERKPGLGSAEELLNEVYKSKKYPSTG